MVTLELLFSLFVRSSRSAGSTTLNRGGAFAPVSRFALKRVNVSFTPSVRSHLLYRAVSRFTTPLHAFLFPRSCKHSGILQLIRCAAAVFSATPARLGIKKGSNKALLPSCKAGTLAGVARSCVSFDPMGAWLLRNLPPQSVFIKQFPLQQNYITRYSFN